MSWGAVVDVVAARELRCPAHRHAHELHVPLRTQHIQHHLDQ